MMEEVEPSPKRTPEVSTSRDETVKKKSGRRKVTEVSSIKIIMHT